MTFPGGRSVVFAVCCVGLWHDDLGEKMKITLPGITTLLRCLLLLLLEPERIHSYCFFFLTQGKSDTFLEKKLERLVGFFFNSF